MPLKKEMQKEQHRRLGSDGTERGWHVQFKPQMQKTARAGQKRWKQIVLKMREDSDLSPHGEDFVEQMFEVLERDRDA